MPTVSTTGGKYTPGTALCGDLPGRIQSLYMSASSNPPLDDFWIGIRPTYEGTVSFTTLWECEKGSVISGSGSAIGTSTASNGTAVRIVFSGTAAMAYRMNIGVTDIIGAGTASHYAGKYLVLGRLKCGASTECLIDLYQGLSQVGYSGTPAGIELVGETKVTNTAWKLVELGQVQIPPFGIKVLEGSTYGTAAEKDRELKKPASEPRPPSSARSAMLRSRSGPRRRTLRRSRARCCRGTSSLNLTIGGQVKPYVMTLRRYDLKGGTSTGRMMSRWVVQSLTPKG